MEYELIEALLAERSLGDLSEETGELLDEYIAGKPEYIELARSFERLSLAGTKLAICGDDIKLPDFPRERIERAISSRGVWASNLRWLSTAAAFVIGLSVMFYMVNSRDIGPVLSAGSVEQFEVVGPLIERGMVEKYIDKGRILKRYEGAGGVSRTNEISIMSKMKGLL